MYLAAGRGPTLRKLPARRELSQLSAWWDISGGGWDTRTASRAFERCEARLRTPLPALAVAENMRPAGITKSTRTLKPLTWRWHTEC